MITKIGLDTKAIPPFSFDGHGVNDANGQRICKVTSCDPYIYPDGQAIRNTEFDRLSNVLAAAPELLEALEYAQELISIARRYFPKSVQNSDTFQLENVNATIGKAIRKARGE